ncbi:MAG: HD domain-containing protein [Myxococcota bacterium]
MPSDLPVTYSERFDQAVALAVRDFRPIVRKKGNIPYITHLFAVTALVGEHGGDEDQLIAAVLHDWLEDIEGATPARLEAEFGPRVREFVEALSDVVSIRPKPPWRDRKTAFIDRIRNEAVEVKLICTADKLHNVRSLRREVEAEGAAALDHFNGGRDGTLWYYAAMVHALGQGWRHPLLDELTSAVAGLHTDCGAPWESA